MKPFDLEAAKRGEPIEYFNNSKMPVRFLSTLETKNGWVAVAYKHDDEEFVERVPTSALVMAPRREKRWIVSWINSNRMFIANGFTDERIAKSEANRCKRDGCTNVQIRETEVEL